jgi:hypothetical protein
MNNSPISKWCVWKDQTFSMGILLCFVCLHYKRLGYVDIFCLYHILSECIEVYKDLFVTFGQCTSILTEIKWIMRMFGIWLWLVSRERHVWLSWIFNNIAFLVFFLLTLKWWWIDSVIRMFSKDQIFNSKTCALDWFPAFN